jgi:hypothetical protein
MKVEISTTLIKRYLLENVILTPLNSGNHPEPSERFAVDTVKKIGVRKDSETIIVDMILLKVTLEYICFIISLQRPP